MQFLERILIILFFCTLAASFTSAETLVFNQTVTDSGTVQQVNSDHIADIRPSFSADNLTIQIYRLDKTLNQNHPYLIPFKTYRFKVSPAAEYISTNFENRSLNQFLDRINGHPTHLRTITSPNDKVLFFQRDETSDRVDQSYNIRIYPSSNHTNISVMAAEDSGALDRQKLAINPSRTECGYYWNPNSSFQMVNESCQEFRANQTADSTGQEDSGSIKSGPLTLAAILVLISIPVYLALRSILYRCAVFIVKRKTDKILKQVKLQEPNGDILDQVRAANKQLNDGNTLKAMLMVVNIDRSISDKS